jgi:UDPglucose 6-dehydrogenase
MEVQRVACIGAGYVGGPTMAVLASKCPEIQVTVIDIDARQIEMWNSNTLPVYEQGLYEIVQQARGRNLHFSTAIFEELQNADVIFISVQTPTKIMGEGAGRACDLTYVEQSARSIAKACQGNTLRKVIVEKSTVPVRTAQAISNIIASNCEGLEFAVVSNPEFLAEGTAIQDLLNPDRVLVGGDTGWAVETIVNLYKNWVRPEKILTTSLWSSELSKICCNAMLAQRISSINSISAICEKTGADIDEVARVIGSDHRIGPAFLKTSVGFGGSCLAKDTLGLVYLCESLGLNEIAEYWMQVILMNDLQKKRFARNLVRTLMNTLRDKRVGLLGFAYKKGTADTRESAAAYVTRAILNEGAIVDIYDPKVPKEAILRELKIKEQEAQILFKSSAYKVARGVSALVICTEWEEFRSLDYERIYSIMYKPAYIFDGRNILDHDRLKKIGFIVQGIGKANFTISN